MEDRFATELLHEIKESARRWFIIAMAELVVLFLLFGGILWYFSLPVEEYSESYVQNSDNDSYNQVVKGDMYNGSKAISEENLQEKSGTE